MHLLRIQVSDFHVLKDVDSTFEKPLTLLMFYKGALMMTC